MNPLISIIIPTYNMAVLLDEAIKSVLSQSYKNWELIIIDNYSSDNTQKVIKKYNDERIQSFMIKNNGIIAISRNYGLIKSSGDWITFLDSDDIWYPSRLKIFIDTMNKIEGFDVFITNELLVDLETGFKKKLIYGRKVVSDIFESLLIYGNLFSPSATIIKKDFLIKNEIKFSENKNFVTAEDYDFWLKIFNKKALLASEKTVQGEFRIHGKNNSRNYLHRNNVRNVIKHHIDSLNISKDMRKNLQSKAESRLILTEAKNEILLGNKILGIKKIFTSFIINPAFFIKSQLLKIFKFFK